MTDPSSRPAADAGPIESVTLGRSAVGDPAGAADIHSDDDVLMERIAAGDRAAFTNIVERYRDRLVSYLTHLAGDRARAEDVAQDALVRLYHTAPRYRAQGQLQAYLYKIATNLMRSEQRRAQLARWLSLDVSSDYHQPADGDDPLAGPERAVLDAELQRRLQAELADLPHRFKVPLVLHEIEDWPLSRIAEVTGTREGTVKSRLSRGRRELRRRLAPYWRGGRR